MRHVGILGGEGIHVLLTYDVPGSREGEYTIIRNSQLPRSLHLHVLMPRDIYSSATTHMYSNIMFRRSFTFKERVYTFRHVKPNQEENNGH